MELNINHLRLKELKNDYYISLLNILLPGTGFILLVFSILNKTANTIVDMSNIPVRIPNKIHTFFFTEDTVGIGSLQGNKGFNVWFSSCVSATLS